jgi:SAM-dependent methyltransferase
MSGGANPYGARHTAIREEFGRQAEHWGRDRIDADLLWAAGKMSPPSDGRILDVACGTGLLARALAPRVREVVAVDLTPEMRMHGRRGAELDGIRNVRFEEGAAEALPYESETFDAVVTRFSVHHFEDPGAVLREMTRVSKPGGVLGVIDIVAPEDGRIADRYNHLERLRDPTHTRALSPIELRDRIEAAGVRVTGEFRRDVKNDLVGWLDRTRTAAAARAEILESIRTELAGGPATGMRPFESSGGLGFLHDWEVVVGVRGRGPSPRS